MAIETPPQPAFSFTSQDLSKPRGSKRQHQEPTKVGESVTSAGTGGKPRIALNPWPGV